MTIGVLGARQQRVIAKNLLNGDDPFLLCAFREGEPIVLECNLTQAHMKAFNNQWKRHLTEKGIT